MSEKVQYKTDLHVHTSEASGCSSESAPDTVRKYIECGYTTLVVTNHLRHSGDDESYRDFSDNYWNAVALAKKTAHELGDQIHVLGAVELTLNTDNGSDYLVFGPGREFWHGARRIFDMTLEEAYPILSAAGAVVLQAHPIRHRHPQAATHLVDGYEVINSHYHQKSFNHDCVRWARSLGPCNKIFVSGTDHHDAPHYPRSGILTDAPITSEEMLLAVLRERKFSIFCEDVVLSADLAGDRYDFID